MMAGYASLAASAALFYPATLSETIRQHLATGLLVDPALDRVDFPAEDGGEAPLELAIPFLAGMDEVRVAAAGLRIRAGERQLDLADFATRTTTGADVGVLLTLARPARLRLVELVPSFPQSAAASLVDPTFRVVVRPATRTGSTFAFGPPVFAGPAFPAPGPLFGPVLSGITRTPVAGGREQIGFAGVLGDAWLIQYATGASPTSLAPVPFTASVTRVAIDALPRDLAVTLAGEPTPVTLWSHPDLFLPDLGTQEIGFTPAAQGHLQQRLAAAAALPTPPPTLAAPLRFASTSAGRVDVVGKTLDAHYLVRPLGSEPATVRVGGGRAPLVLSAPAGRRPGASAGRLTVRHLGRELNDGSPEAPALAPLGGLRVGIDRWVGAQVPFLPTRSEEAGAVLPLASVRVMIEAADDAEAVVEVRGDVAGLPGPTVSAAVVRQVARGFRDWLEFELAEPLAVVAGGAPVWVTLRTTRGSLRWFAGGDGTGRISGDQGRTWRLVDPLLLAAGGPLVQLYHAVADPPAPPVRLEAGGATLTDDLLAGAVRRGAGEFLVEAFSLPAGIADRLAATVGAGRVATELALASRAVLDLTFRDLVLLYSTTGA